MLAIMLPMRSIDRSHTLEIIITAFSCNHVGPIANLFLSLVIVQAFYQIAPRSNQFFRIYWQEFGVLLLQLAVARSQAPTKLDSSSILNVFVSDGA
jgi:hypothetical protein